MVVRELASDEEARLLQIVRRGGFGPVVTCRRAQMVLLSARGMDVGPIAEVAFTSPDWFRGVLHNFNTDGFESLHPHYAGGRPPKFGPWQREQIRTIALDHPGDRELLFSTWSLSDYLVEQGVVEDISYEGLRMLLREQGVSFPVHQDLENQQRPGLRGIEEPRPSPL